MGIDEHTVVDPQLRGKGLIGLRVIDASSMRRIVSGNTAYGGRHDPRRALTRQTVQWAPDRTSGLGTATRFAVLNASHGGKRSSRALPCSC
ncbi:GMC oxidoreductase [Aminobacter sp. LjRoot7]